MTAEISDTQRLTAIEGIRALPLKYAYAQDSRDAELLLSLWADTDDPVEYPDIDGHTARRDHPRWFSKGPTVHFVGNHLIEVEDGENAGGHVYCWAQLDVGDEFIDQSILYQDRYVRRHGEWLFLKRRHLLWFGQARAEHPLHQPADDWPRRHAGRGTLPTEILADQNRSTDSDS